VLIRNARGAVAARCAANIVFFNQVAWSCSGSVGVRLTQIPLVREYFGQ
jgi:hypothetical protein